MSLVICDAFSFLKTLSSLTTVHLPEYLNLVLVTMRWNTALQIESYGNELEVVLFAFG